MATIGKKIYEVSAPGRVCLVGEHCDYAKGKCIALPIMYKRVKAYGIRKTGAYISFYSIFQGKEERLRFKTGDALTGLDSPLRYSWAVVQALLNRGLSIGGGNIHFESDLPAKKGVSSSAAVSVATARVFNKMYELGLSDEDIAEIAYEAEHDILGIGCGRMDQIACAFESLVLLDFSSSLVPKVFRILKPSVKLHLLVGIPTTTQRDTAAILRECNMAYFSPKSDSHLMFGKTLDKHIPRRVIEPMVEAFQKEDLLNIGELMRKNQKLYDLYFRPVSRHFDSAELYQCLKIARNSGSLGEKWLGAGGAGAFICLLASPEDRDRLKVSLLQSTDMGLEFIDIDY